MSNTRAKASTQHKASGFNLDYACSLSVRKGRSHSKTSADAHHKERRGQT